MSSTLFDDTLAVPFQSYKAHSHPEIPHLIEYLTLICQDPQAKEYQLAFDELETIITDRVECEDEAATAKTIISTLLQTITNTDTVSSELPSVVAQLTESILNIIPATMRDWTRSEDSQQGPALFAQLLEEGLNFYSDPPPHRSGDEELDIQPLFSFLSQSARLQLSDFIKELADLKIIYPLVVYEFLIKFLHSVAVPTPSPWELECACRLLRAEDDEVRELLWIEAICNALEIIRARDGNRLEQKIHVLLLVISSRYAVDDRKPYG